MEAGSFLDPHGLRRRHAPVSRAPTVSPVLTVQVDEADMVVIDTQRLERDAGDLYGFSRDAGLGDALTAAKPGVHRRTRHDRCLRGQDRFDGGRRRSPRTCGRGWSWLLFSLLGSITYASKRYLSPYLCCDASVAGQALACVCHQSPRNKRQAERKRPHTNRRCQPWLVPGITGAANQLTGVRIKLLRTSRASGSLPQNAQGQLCRSVARIHPRAGGGLKAAAQFCPASVQRSKAAKF